MNRETQQWISVEDKLPKNDDEILLYCKGVHKGIYLTRTNKFYFSGTGKAANQNLVTHWQPLPSHPTPKQFNPNKSNQEKNSFKLK